MGKVNEERDQREEKSKRSKVSSIEEIYGSSVANGERRNLSFEDKRCPSTGAIEK